jgi:hypothetical protein
VHSLVQRTCASGCSERKVVSFAMLTILVLILLLLMLAALPTWPYSQGGATSQAVGSGRWS